MRALMALAGLAVIAAATPAFADFECRAERTAGDRAKAEVRLILDDAGALKSGRVRWGPRALSPLGANVVLVYDLTNGAMVSAALTALEVKSQAYILRTSPERMFFAVQVDRATPTVREWAAYTVAKNGGPTSGGANRSDYTDKEEVFPRSEAGNAALFSQLEASDAKILRIHSLADDGHRASSIEYDLGSGMAANNLATRAYADARALMPNYRQRCDVIH